jgi:hypothetical protein
VKTVGVVFLVSILFPTRSAFSQSFSFAQDKDPASGATATAAGNRPEEVKDRYHVVQVNSITVQPDVQFPAEFLTNLQDEIGKELAHQKEFQEVIAPGQTPANAGAPTLRLGTEITGYKPGNRAKRYIIAYGAGSTEVDAKILFLDGGTGRTLMTEDLRALLAGGLFGGGAEGVLKEFARQIVVKTKLMLAKRLPGPEELARVAEAPKPSERIGEDAAERHTLTIPGKDGNWILAQQQLDEESAAGFRAAGLTLKGKSGAEVLLKKVASPPQVYTYKLLHTILISTLQKEVNSASADGFRVAENTFAVLGNNLTVIMEKPPVPLQTRYQYLANHSIRISSAQKNTEQNETKGYTLIAETEQGGLHLLLFEKATEEKK